MRDLYEVLGVAKDADQASIRTAFKKLARRYHPDVSQEADAERTFKEVNAAYQVLSDEQKRTWYDEFGEDSLRPGFDADRARMYRQAGRAGGFNPFAGSAGDGVSLDELFGSMFGGGGGGGGGPGFRSGWDGPVTARRRGPDMETQVEIDLLTAVHGGEVLVGLRRPESCASCQGQGGTEPRECLRCHGTGRARQSRFGMQAMVLCEECAGSGSSFAQECPVCAGSGRTMIQRRLKLRVPPGVGDGQVLRLRGLGGEGRRGGPAGNLLVSVQVRPHPVLQRKGHDLEIEVPITIREALEGARVTVPTPDGEVKLRVPPGARNGQRLRLKGRGLPRSNGERGHLYVVLRPVVPITDDPQALELASQLDAFHGADVRADLQL